MEFSLSRGDHMFDITRWMRKLIGTLLRGFPSLSPTPGKDIATIKLLSADATSEGLDEGLAAGAGSCGTERVGVRVRKRRRQRSHWDPLELPRGTRRARLWTLASNVVATSPAPPLPPPTLSSSRSR
jgi:hypothetical protein